MEKSCPAKGNGTVTSSRRGGQGGEAEEGCPCVLNAYPLLTPSAAFACCRLNLVTLVNCVII